MEVKGFPNYKIYPDGTVWSKKRPGTDGRFLRPGLNSRGYLHYILMDNGKRKNYDVHRLVAEHYIPNQEGKPQVDHINRNRQDNRVKNLRWVTHSENSQNKGKQSNNRSGHKFISPHPRTTRWRFMIQGKFNIQKTFKTKKEALCYKFIILLKIKSNLI